MGVLLFRSFSPGFPGRGSGMGPAPGSGIPVPGRVGPGFMRDFLVPGACRGTLPGLYCSRGFQSGFRFRGRGSPVPGRVGPGFMRNFLCISQRLELLFRLYINPN
jgi:hypothetical protein